jgi:cytochrome c6
MNGWTAFARGSGRAVLVLLPLFALCSPGAKAADVMRGRDLYAAHCAVCHGPNGVPRMPGAPGFSRGEAMFLPDGVLLQRIRSGRNTMPAYDGVLPDRDILSIVAFLRTFH